MKPGLSSPAGTAGMAVRSRDRLSYLPVYYTLFFFKKQARTFAQSMFALQTLLTAQYSF